MTLSTSTTRPRFIALCGWPKTGKSEVQRILERDYGVTMVDDGECLRDFAIRHCGATHDDVYTQEGKMREVVMPGGARMTWRKMLGDLGVKVEEMFGPDFIPESAILKCHDANKVYAFASVRREQGWVYRRHGGIVVEIENRFIPPSPYEFDVYAKEPVTHRIQNHVHPDSRSAETLKTLENATRALFDEILTPSVELARAS